ncbi:MAG TPA: hypothetical protein VMZ92_01820 [Planctomycetota bacterium]|nr:hypothetical protein [Planctomycetota bacterium]
MDTAETYKRLQEAADYRVVRNALLGGAAGAIGLGLIALLTGFVGKAAPWVSVLLAVVGIFMVAVGVWMAAKPSLLALVCLAHILLVGGTGTLLIGVLAVVLNPKEPVFLSGIFAAFSVMTIGWGIRYYRYGKRYKEADLSRPATQYLRWVGEEVKTVERSLPKHYLDIFELHEGDQMWRGQMLPDGVFLMKLVGVEVLVYPREGLSLEWEDSRKKSTTIVLGLGDRVIKGKIRTEQARRLSTWKSLGEPGLRALRETP